MDAILTVDSNLALDKTIKLRELTILPGAEIAAPEGKFINLCVNGTGKPITPGVYRGDITLSVAELYKMPPHGLMKPLNRFEDFRNTIVVSDGKLIAEKCIPAMWGDCEVTDSGINGGHIRSSEDSFNGVLVTGGSQYEINGLRVDFEGLGANDFVGTGSAVAVIDNAHVTLNDCEFHVNGVTRCAIHAGGDSVVTVNNCRVSNQSPDNPEWMSDFAWGIGITGTNRLVQACDNTTVYYNNCDLDSNGWAIFSIDGHDKSVKIYVKDSRINLSGPRVHGYGIFCIGSRNVTSFDNCRIHVDGYPLLIMGSEELAKAEIKNGCEVTGSYNCVLIAGDYNTDVDISDSIITTGKSTIVVKGSATEIKVSGCRLKPGNGVILQLMDNDECGMDCKAAVLPIGKEDTYINGRDLCAINPKDDIVLNLSNMEIRGDFYNSTTNLHMEEDRIKGGVGTTPVFGGMFVPPEGADSAFEGGAPGAAEGFAPKTEIRGPKNLALNLRDVRLEGIVSSASFEYEPGLAQIDESTRLELGNITQKAAPTINNGVIVSVDSDSTWVITGISYLTGISVKPGALIKASEGYRLRMTLDGIETEIQPGDYKGKIVIEPVNA